jgi:ubiquinone/menaquinone biosynthesis C-methylase UbiE
MSRGLPFYEESEFHDYLISRERLEIFNATRILSQLNWKGVKDFLDFGAGPGFFIPHYYAHKNSDCHIWAAECQEVLLDYLLQQKIKQNWSDFSAFYVERTEHPLLPDWIPPMDLVFCSLVLSTFADPALALNGLRRSLSENASIVILDWEKMEAPSGPDESMKVSKSRMEYFIDDAGYKIVRNIKVNKYLYCFEIIPDPERIEDRSYLQA